MAVTKALDKRGVAVALVDVLSAKQSLWINSGGTLVATLEASNVSIDWSRLRSVWWRRARPDIGLTARARYVEDEWSHFVASVETAAPLARWTNKPSNEARASRKLLQLQEAAKVGLRVPASLATSNASDARAFVSEHQRCIYKRLGTAAGNSIPTREVDSGTMRRLDVLDKCPALFQEFIPARLDIRATAIGSSVTVAEIDSQVGRSPLDWRLDHSVPFRPHSLDPLTAQRLVDLSASLQLFYCAIDLRLTPDGEYVFLDLNPAGQFLFVELLSGLPITDRLAAHLAS